jgi:putative membrane protein
MTGENQRRGPVLIELEREEEQARRPVIVESADFTEAEAQPVEPAVQPTQRRFSWLGSVVGAAIVSLLLLYLADALWDLLIRLGAKSPVLGQIGLGLVGILAVVAVLWFAREAIAILRLRKVEQLRRKAAAARASGEAREARAAVAALLAFYATDPTSAGARARIAGLDGQIIDGPTLLDEAERQLLQSKDDHARNLVGQAAQRVSIVTAVSPRAIVDIAFVLGQSIRLIRDLSALYGGRAGGLGLARLATRIGGHLLVTGGMAAADQVLGQVLGSGLAARVSARLGEGMLNGVLTARIGIAAIGLCRPMDFCANTPVLLSEVVKTSIIQKEVAEKPAG